MSLQLTWSRISAIGGRDSNQDALGEAVHANVAYFVLALLMLLGVWYAQQRRLARAAAHRAELEQQVSDRTFEAAKKVLGGDRGVVDLTATLGLYQTVAMLMVVDRMPLPAGVEPLKPLP